MLLLDSFIGTIVDGVILVIANEEYEDDDDSCERLAALETGREEEVDDNLLDPEKSDTSLAAVVLPVVSDDSWFVSNRFFG